LPLHYLLAMDRSKLDSQVLVAPGDDGRAAAIMPPPFQSVYHEYFDFVWSSARRFGIEPGAMDDVVQEVFIVIYNRLSTLEKPEALRSWIYGIVRRTVSDHRRTRSVQATGGAGGVEATASSAPTPLEHTEKKAELDILEALLAQLDDQKREIFSLVELQELPVPEAAKLLELPLNTAYSRLRAARRAFEEALVRYEARNKGK
jgi:RNA polymerase sigma-70 factor (ECF subfamily)